MLQSVRTMLSEIESRLDDPGARGLAAAVTRAIRDGALQPGDRLPPIRQVAHELALSPTTVSSAWGLLSRAGSIRTAGRRGTVVADHAGPRDGRYLRALEHAETFPLDLATGVPDADLLPGLGRAMRSVTTAGTPESYLDDPVLPGLREVVEADWPYPPPALTVVDGAMDGLELVIRAVLRFGDRVVVEHPTFPPLLDLLEAAGADVVGVPLDEDGVVPAELAAVLAPDVRAVFLQPRGHNPTGVSTSARRLAELAGVLLGSDALVVEDDSAGGISPSPDVSLGTVLPDRTVHVRSWSKSHGPDLRLAAMSGPEDLLAEVRHLRQLGQGWSSRLLQRVLLHLLTDDAGRQEVEHAKQEYARRRSRFVEVLADHGIEVPGVEGLNVWVPVAEESAALLRLAARGIGVAPGRPFDVLPSEQDHVRVTTGLLRDRVEEVAGEVAAAARAGSRPRMSR
jgi:DNA-binding transcriptional MocR family regulator